MSKKFCAHCGSGLNPNGKFCTHCGSASGLPINGIPKEKEKTPQGATKNTEQKTEEYTYTATTNEIMVFTQKETTRIEQINPIAGAGPVKYFFNGFGRMLKGFPGVFKNKKKLIFTSLLALTWLALLILPIIGVDPTAFKWLNILTFARGGMNGGALGLMGGVIGKGVFAFFLFSLFTPVFGRGKPLPGLGKGFKTFFKSFAVKDLGMLSVLLLGLGLSLVTYNFLTGNASIQNCMVGIAAFFISVRALGSKTGFLRGLLLSMSKKQKNKKTKEPLYVNHLMAGWAAGFIFGIALSNTGVSIIGYIAGLVFVVAAMIIKIIAGNKKMATAMIALALLFPWAFTMVSLAERNYEFESVHIQYDEQAYKMGGPPGYAYAVPLREMIKRFDVTVYQDQEFVYEDSITVSKIVMYDKRTVEGSGTLKLNGKVVYDDLLGYPTVEGTLYYTATVTDIDGNLEKRDKTEWNVECTGPFILGVPMLDHYTDTYLRYGGAFTDEDTNIVKQTIYYKNGKTYNEESEAGYFGIDFVLGSQAKMLQTDAVITPEPKKEEQEIDKKPVVQIEDTKASETAGEMTTSLIAVIITGALAAVVGTTGGDSGGTESGGSTYKMILQKGFGNGIRVGSKPVVVNAHIIEVTNQGVETERLDLTAKIEIFSPDNSLAVSDVVMSGNSKQASLQAPGGAAPAQSKHKGQNQGTVSFRYTGEGGMFQNNVKFKLVGESQIKLADNKLPILATSTESFELVYELVDFTTKPEVTLDYKSDLFELKIDKNKTGQDVIVALPTAKAAQMNFQRFIHRYACEIIAKTDEETIKEKFELHLCYEGIGTAYKDLKNNATPDEIILKCYPEGEKDKREKTAFNLALAVMIWNPTSKMLEPDIAVAQKLTIEFTAHTGSQEVNSEAAIKAVKDAKIISKLETGLTPTNLNNEMKPALYKMYSNASPMAGAAEIDLIISVNSEEVNLETFTLKGKIKPLPDYKFMVKWLLEYPKGTYAEKYLQIGDVNTYFGALDFIENRVYSMSNVPFSPRTKENHYEDGVLDVMRPTAVVLQDTSMPEKIGEFEKILSLVHELTHTIEHQNGDTGGNHPERHTYFIENLARATRTLADMEKKASADIEKLANNAILYFHEVFFNKNNAQPQTFSWFGTKYQTQHYIFDSYSNFDIFAASSSLPDTRKKQIANVFKNRYFPGNLRGSDRISKFKQMDGFFKDLTWEIKWYNGVLGQLEPVHPDFMFKRRGSWEWTGGNEMKLIMTLDVESKKNSKTDVLQVEIDAGKFDRSDYNYPVVNKFTVTWKATYRISDCIMGSPIVKCEAVKQ